MPGARDLLDYLTAQSVPWAIGTSGRIESARVNVDKLGLDADKIPMMTRDQVRYAKPDPGLFLAAADRLKVDVRNSVVVGDDVWDLLAAPAPALSESACCPAAMAKMNWSAQVPTACTKTRPTC